MRRLERTDLVLLATLVPLWLTFLGLHVTEVTRSGLLKPPLFVSAAERADDYPRVQGFFVGRERVAESSGIRIGDRLLHAGGVDLRGAGHVRAEAVILALGSEEGRLDVGYERDGIRRETELPLTPLHTPAWGRVPVIVVSGIVALIILLRAPSIPQARAVFVTGMLWICLLSDFGGGSLARTYAWKIAHPLLAMTVIPLVLRWAQDFPDELPRPRKLLQHWPWLFALLHGGVRTGYYFGGPFPPAYVSASVAVVDGLSAVAFLGVLTLNYRRTDPVGRRQIKWVLLGFYVGLLPFAVTALVTGLTTRPTWQGVLFGMSVVCTLACALGFLIAIVRYNLYDIDRVITATASYTLIGFVLLAAFLIVIPPLATELSGLMGLPPTTGQFALIVALAAVVVPTNRRLRPRIERLFFPERGAFERGIGALMRDLARQGSPRDLLATLGERLWELVKPETCVIYWEMGPAYTPTFARGRPVPSAIRSDGSLVAALRRSPEPVPAEPWSGSRRGKGLDPLDLAALDALAAALLAPIRQAEQLPAFLCLGRKRSGDIYTSTDRSLLGAACQELGLGLERFGEAEAVRRSMKAYGQVRRYVPRELAVKLERGELLEPAELEVSVFFVDIRGYTTYSEGRRAREIFSTVNRFTEVVSTLIARHGGSIVEFGGDGMMAVFGAPDPLPGKERAAVEAGLAVVESVAALPLGAVDDEAIEVGVGIATGPAVAGSIRLADRMTWSAIGNTTNLAARLQTLTRDLGAAIVIDAPTHDRAGRVAASFVFHPGQPIRGLRQREDVFSLPLRPAARSPDRLIEPARDLSER